MIAAGTESMSAMPQIMGNKISLNPAVFEKEENLGIAFGMGLTAEKVAQQWKVSRQAQDQFAYESHMKALKAQQAGEFTDEITPVEVTDRTADLETGEVIAKSRIVSLDEGARPDTALDSLAKLKTPFAARGSVTAGNSSQTSDGAGALILASESAIKQFGLRPLARFVSYAAKGVPPEIMGSGPIEAIPAALRYAGLKQQDIDWIELNEAFAAQYLSVEKELKLDSLKTNVNGGAIAVGHPLAASGTRIMNHLVYELHRRGGKYALGSACIGGGQGIAMVIERV